MQNKNSIILLVVFILFVIGGVVIYFIFPQFGQKVARVVDIRPEKPQVIEEKLVIPETKEITGGEGSVVGQGEVSVPLVPKNESEKVIVPKAILTVKGSYDLAKTEAEKWSSDTLPVFIKSLGTITLDGKSSQWQLVFSSKINPKKGYEIIVQGDQIVSQKEIDSNAIGAEMPKNWIDSGEAIKKLQAMPQYSTVSISTINFFYNVDAKEWRYGFSTSVGATSVRL